MMCKRNGRFFASPAGFSSVHPAEIVLHYFDARNRGTLLIPTRRTTLATLSIMTAGAPCPRLAAIVVALSCAMACSPRAVTADCDQPFEPRPSDQIWLVSTRNVGDVSVGSGWGTSRYDAGYWKGSDDTTFSASDDEETVTIIYVHGNRMDPAGAEARGLAIYRELFSNQTDGKIRFVIWSWPSTQIHGLAKDVRSKAARSDDEAFLLARFLAPIPENRRVGLIGFSFGARIISGSLHMLGGGEMLGRRIESGKRASFRVVYWAAGVQNDWLLPENVQGRALPVGQKWLNISNHCDSVLRRFDRIDRCDCSAGLGFTGLAGKDQLPADLAARYEDWDAGHLLGNDHRSEPYFFQNEVIRRTRETVMSK